MPDDLIPEMHDILKLCNGYRFSAGKRAKSPHSNPYAVLEESLNKGYKLNGNPSWFGVLKHHHGGNFKLCPDTPDLFLLDMADSLAAAISRGDNQLRLGYKSPFKRYGFDDRVFKLWKNHDSEVKRCRLMRPLGLNQVFDFLQKNPNIEDFFTFVGSSICERAEDATIGANLTSLYIHSILTGKFYRILKQSSYNINQSELGKRKKLQELYKDKLNNWSLTVTKLKIFFPQKPIRTKDMNVFGLLDEIRNNLEEDFSDNIFFNTSDEILMVQTPDKDISVLTTYLRYGFWIEYSHREQLLKSLSPNPDIGDGKFKEGVIYQDLKYKIDPPICEICQKNKGDKKWVRDYILTMDICDSCKRIIEDTSWPPAIQDLCYGDIDGLEKWIDETIEEDLCQNCFDIRVVPGGTRLHKLEKWEEDKELNPKVIWIKVNLDISKLIDSLKSLYTVYLNKIGVPDPKDKAEIRFSVLSEFHRDYEGFLERFEKCLRDLFQDDMEVPILKDFYVIKINTLSQIIEVIKIYYGFVTEYFPQFKTLADSPLKLSISCSRIKFPFFEHWEILQKPKSDIHITLVDKGEVEILMSKMEEILNMTQDMTTHRSINALHKLVDIAKLSQKLAEVALKDKSDKYYETIYKRVLPLGMDFKSLLTFIKIVEDQYEVSQVSSDI